LLGNQLIKKKTLFLCGQELTGAHDRSLVRYNLQPNITIALVGVGCPVVFKDNSLCAHFGLTNKTKFSVAIYVYAMNGDGFNYLMAFWI
jgi:hypothetical protein